MTVLTAAYPVTEAIVGVLQDATLQAAVRWLGDSLPEDCPRPCVLLEVLSETDTRGFGTGNLPELDFRTHVFSEIGSLVQAQAINTQIVALLKDATLTITGYALCGRIVWHETVTLQDQELNGIKVHEVVSLYTIWAEQT